MNNSKNLKEKSYLFRTRRFLISAFPSIFIFNPCEAKPMRVTLNVVLFSYLDRPIFDVFVDGKAGLSSGVYPDTGGATVMNVTFDLGIKKVSWRLDGSDDMPRNGDTVKNKNKLCLDTITQGAKYLSVHIYPDDTVDLLTTIEYPDISVRGKLEISKLKKKHG